MRRAAGERAGTELKAGNSFSHYQAAANLPADPALDACQPTGPLIHHSDRGGQYSSDDFRDELAKHGIIASMSGTGNCYDNVVVESFFGAVKRERVNRVRYQTREEARADLFEYIEVFYNRKRRHGYIGNISPDDFERQSIGSF